jgi:hypothetical protein
VQEKRPPFVLDGRFGGLEVRGFVVSWYNEGRSLALIMDSLDRRAERLAGTVRLLRQDDDGAFDRQFWRAIPPAQRLEMMWDMVVEWIAWRDGADGEPRLQRSVCRLERGGG